MQSPADSLSLDEYGQYRQWIKLGREMTLETQEFPQTYYQKYACCYNFGGHLNEV